MASFKKVKGGNRWLADRKEFEPKATKLKVGLLERLFGLEYYVPPEGVQVFKPALLMVWRKGTFICLPLMRAKVSPFGLYSSTLEGIWCCFIVVTPKLLADLGGILPWL